MRKIFEHRFEPTQQELERIQELKLDVWNVIIPMPENSHVLRVNTRILKVERTVVDPQTKQIVRMPVGEECVFVWFDGDPDRPMVDRHFYVISTGATVPDDAVYVGTFLLQMGSFVYQVYEKVIVN